MLQWAAKTNLSLLRFSFICHSHHRVVNDPAFTDSNTQASMRKLRIQEADGTRVL